MPVVQGWDLDDVVRKLVQRDPATVAEFALPCLIAILIAVGDAVANAHARGVVHRDLKSQNIMLGRFGEVFVLDWGIAKLMGRPATEARQSVSEPGRRVDLAIDAESVPTLSGTVIGTPGYMAPEQARGETDVVGFAADVYALGVILYQLLTLGMPVDMSSAETALSDTGSGRIRDARNAGAQVPRALAAVAARATAFVSTERYADAAALVADLRAWLEDREVSAHPDGPLARALRWQRRHRAATALIVGTLLSTVVAAIVVLALVSGHNAERARLAEIARVEAERAGALERAGRQRLERRAAAVSEYLPGLSLLERAEWNPVWAERAVAAFDRAIAADPELAEAHRARARALHLAGRGREALVAYQRALELAHAALGRDDPELLRLIGDLLWMELKDIPAATTWFRRAAAADPANPHARVAKAILRSLVGEHAAAIADMRALAAEAPDWWEVQQCLGMLQLGASPSGESMNLQGGPQGLGDPKEAEAAFSQAIRLRPGYASLYLYRGMARTMQYYMRGDTRPELLEGCLADYDIAVKLAPDMLNAHVNRMQAKFYMQRKAVIQEELDILRTRWPKEPLALEARAIVELPAGKGAALLAEVEVALQEAPGSTVLTRLRDRLRDKLQPRRVTPATPPP
jgi:tetratricopeptide (TPR) repeat protein